MTEIMEKHMQYKNICLVIIFNHRYDKNIEKLKMIYQDRFSKIVFLVPFYDGEQQNVIPVYECSYQFPGFLIQAYEKLIHFDADYYFFISDDLILTPHIDERNVLKQLKMENKMVFITNIFPLNSKGSFGWNHARFSSSAFLKESTQWKGNIPGYDVALKKFQDFFGTEYEEEYGKEFFDTDFCYDNPQKRYEEIGCFLQRNGNSFKIPYPMARGYSDIFMIKKEKLFPIARLCGVFSAMNLFAEISFPTSVVLSVEREDVSFLEDAGFQCEVKWNEERKILEEEFNGKFDLLYEEWKKENLYVHPIKLSKWTL